MQRHVFRSLDSELSIPEFVQTVCQILEDKDLGKSPLLSSHPPNRALPNTLYVYKIGNPPRFCVDDDWAIDGWKWKSNSNSVVKESKLSKKMRQLLGDNQELRVYKWHCDLKFFRRAIKVTMKKDDPHKEIQLSSTLPFVFVIYGGDNTIPQATTQRTFKSVIKESLNPLVRPSHSITKNLDQLAQLGLDKEDPVSSSAKKRCTFRNTRQIYHARFRDQTKNLSPLENLTSGAAKPFVLEASFSEESSFIVFSFKPALGNFVHFIKRKRSKLMVHVDGTFGYCGMNLLLASCRDPRLQKGPPMLIYGALHRTKTTDEYFRIFTAVKSPFPELFSLPHMMDEEIAFETALRRAGVTTIRKCLRHIMETEKRSLSSLRIPSGISNILLKAMKKCAYAQTPRAFNQATTTLQAMCPSSSNHPDDEDDDDDASANDNNLSDNNNDDDDDDVTTAISNLKPAQRRGISRRVERFIEKTEKNGAHTYGELGIVGLTDYTNNIAESVNNRLQQAVLRNRYRCDTLVMRITALMEQDERSRQIFFWLGGETRDIVWTAKARAMGRNCFKFPMISADIDEDTADGLLKEPEDFDDEARKEEEEEEEEEEGDDLRRAVERFKQQQQEQEQQEPTMDVVNEDWDPDELDIDNIQLAPSLLDLSQSSKVDNITESSSRSDSDQTSFSLSPTHPHRLESTFPVTLDDDEDNTDTEWNLVGPSENHSDDECASSAPLIRAPNPEVAERRLHPNNNNNNNSNDSNHEDDRHKTPIRKDGSSHSDLSDQDPIILLPLTASQSKSNAGLPIEIDDITTTNTSPQPAAPDSPILLTASQSEPEDKSPRSQSRTNKSGGKRGSSPSSQEGDSVLASSSPIASKSPSSCSNNSFDNTSSRSRTRSAAASASSSASTSHRRTGVPSVAQPIHQGPSQNPIPLSTDSSQQGSSASRRPNVQTAEQHGTTTVDVSRIREEVAKSNPTATMKRQLEAILRQQPAVVQHSPSDLIVADALHAGGMHLVRNGECQCGMYSPGKRCVHELIAAVVCGQAADNSGRSSSSWSRTHRSANPMWHTTTIRTPGRKGQSEESDVVVTTSLPMSNKHIDKAIRKSPRRKSATTGSLKRKASRTRASPKSKKSSRQKQPQQQETPPDPPTSVPPDPPRPVASHPSQPTPEGGGAPCDNPTPWIQPQNVSSPLPPAGPFSQQQSAQHAMMGAGNFPYQFSPNMTQHQFGPNMTQNPFSPNTSQFPFNTTQYPFNTSQYPFNTSQYPFNTSQFPFNTSQFPFNTSQFQFGPNTTPSMGSMTPSMNYPVQAPQYHSGYSGPFPTSQLPVGESPPSEPGSSCCSSHPHSRFSDPECGTVQFTHKPRSRHRFRLCKSGNRSSKSTSLNTSLNNDRQQSPTKFDSSDHSDSEAQVKKLSQYKLFQQIEQPEMATQFGRGKRRHVQ